jgi:hypothetical protein
MLAMYVKPFAKIDILGESASVLSDGEPAGVSLIPSAEASNGVPGPRYLALIASLFFLRSSISLASSTGSPISTTGSLDFLASLSKFKEALLDDVSSTPHRSVGLKYTYLPSPCCRDADDPSRSA